MSKGDLLIMVKIGDKGREVEELEIEGTSFMDGP